MDEVLTGKRVSRLDSISLDSTYFTPEGFLIDEPIVTSCGIFEYHLPDGTVRRELRLPEHVFEEESLKSYLSKPVIITHNAGKVTKDNVSDEIVGTIISEGYRDKDSVRAKVVIHDVNAVKDCGMRELSLGYDLELIEQSGVWNGEKYDAIQKNIKINHLAIVKTARAGNQAHLNMDNKDKSIFDDKENLKGGKKMIKATNRDAMLSPEDFAASIEAYKAKKAELTGGATETAPVGTPAETPAEEPAKEPAKDGGIAEPKQEPIAETPAKAEETPTKEPVAEPTAEPAEPKEGGTGEPKDMAEAMELISTLTATVQQLQGVVDKMQAEKDIKGAEPVQEDGGEVPPTPPAPVTQEESEKKEDEPVMKMDSIDAIVSQKLELGKVGTKLNLDGLEMMEISEAKKKVIMAVQPNMRLDGKSDAYIDAAYEMARDMANAIKTTDDQRAQMANGQRLDGMADEVKGPSCSAYEARQRLINSRENRE